MDATFEKPWHDYTGTLTPVRISSYTQTITTHSLTLTRVIRSLRKEDLMKRPLHLFLFSIVVCLLLAACVGPTTSSGTPTESSSMTLNVFAAASLTASFNEIANTYHQMHPNITIKPVYNGSQILEQQIAIKIVVQERHLERARIGFGEAILNLRGAERHVGAVIQFILRRPHEHA